ncbi:hypothetical protein PV08_06407 [Exophiala spinifera]|uniref:Major facilitator superfamily (MFS) profile domain-containing protein n=1 Tax=Exophiala spinifera TaxID=91928 RepID=A0A0D1YMT2_9EURO|nr:uncharacterized protein PV08_06407 [Exophiala spinifera]KIW16356.1 hypothetical protein PV08_06407 [Exophiala spinifera]
MSSPNIDLLGATQGSQGDGPAPPKVHVHMGTVVAVIAVNFALFGQLVSLVGSGFLAQTMATALGDTSKAVWFSTSLTIATITLNPPISQAADYWGRKWFLVVTNALAVVGCIVISRSENIATCIVGFCIMGVSFGSQSLMYSVVSEVLPRRYRGIGQGSLNISSAAGGSFALLVGGALVRHNAYHFRIYWYITCGVYAVATVGVFIGYDPPTRPLQRTLTACQKLRELDWIGFFLITAGLTLFAIGLQFSGNPYSWRDGPVLGPFIVGVCLLITFCLYEWLGRSDGLLHHGLFQDRNFAIALFAIFTEGLAFLTSNSYFAYEVAVLTHVSLFKAVVHFSIFFFGGIICSALAGLMVTRTKSVREPLVFGFAVLLAYNACMISIKSTAGEGFFWAFAVLGSIGLGFILTTITIAAQMSAPPEMISVTTGLLIACRSVGGTIALAVNNAIFSNSINHSVPSQITRAVLPLGFPAQNLTALIHALLSNKPALVAKVPGINQEIALAAEGALFKAYAISFRHVWIAATSFCAAGFLASCLFRNNKSNFTAEIDAPMARELEEVQGFKLAPRSEHQEMVNIERAI